MITPAYLPTASERILPRLALDFTTGVLDARVGVSRALNTATRVNSSGLIEIVNADTPRLDYDPAAPSVCKGLLVEETRANRLTYSEDFTQSVWVKTRATISPDVETAPDGTLADKLVEDNTAANSHLLNRILGNPLAAETYTFTIYVKQAGRRYMQGMFIIDAASTNRRYAVMYDLELGAVTSTSTTSTPPTAISNAIQNAGNGWYRCSITVGNPDGKRVDIQLSTSTTATATVNTPLTNGNGVSGLFIWGAQFEVGAFATSYIPTTTASLTRNADVVSVTGANFSSWWQATTGGMSVRARQNTITGTRPWAYMSDGTADNIIALRGSDANPELYIKATTDQAQIDAGTLAATTTYSLVGAWNTNDCAAAISGGAAVTDTSVTVPTVDRMLIGSDGTNYLNGWAEKIAFWPQRITNAEVSAFSKL